MNSRLNFVWLSNTASPQRNISGILVPRPPRGVALPGDVGQWQCHGGSRQVSCVYPELPDTQGLSQTPCQLPGTLTAKAQGPLLICRQDWPLWAGFAVDSIIPLDQLEASWSSAHVLLVVTPAEENFWSWGCTKAVSDPWATQSSWNSQTQCTPDDWMRLYTDVILCLVEWKHLRESQIVGGECIPPFLERKWEQILPWLDTSLVITAVPRHLSSLFFLLFPEEKWVDVRDIYKCIQVYLSIQQTDWEKCRAQWFTVSGVCHIYSEQIFYITGTVSDHKKCVLYITALMHCFMVLLQCFTQRKLVILYKFQQQEHNSTS